MMDTRSQSRLTGLNSPVRPMAVGAVQHWMGDAGMFVYDFEVLKGDTVVASKRSIALPDVSAAWPKIANLAETIEEPGYKIRVRDQAGGIVILIGVAALRICVPGKTTSGRSIQARQSSSRSREYLFSLGYPFNRSCAYAVAMERPRVSTHYPKSLGEFQAWFPTDADCLDYLEWLRWPCGFVCPSCGHPGGWRLGDGRFMCTGCGNRTSVMAGTIFDRTRTPLTVWFSVCWHFAAGKDGVSALSLKRTLEIGSYQTVWAILHRLRS